MSEKNCSKKAIKMAAREIIDLNNRQEDLIEKFMERGLDDDEKWERGAYENNLERLEKKIKDCGKDPEELVISEYESAEKDNGNDND